ncbi:molybdopterin-guanine dinucleotide biosynthesis protein B [Domibacillus indicus]|uniref:molybdopterin-guanine dinucleotide biosynthesis protein B n=1 Tax=Domibacillus indicus TaxID=1437523 RepID=UPI0006181E7C|nr:molybdopterin-guanine dinucleotide biosynthesis protein B [Domibacillus indicus]
MKNVFQIVGYQNSGKTTLMEKLIRAASDLGVKAAAIKHHGHGGVPDYSKDSDRHHQAGALIAGVEGDGVLQLNIPRESWKLKDILALYSLFPVDCIFVEGYKKESYPKAVLIRTEEDLPLLELENIQCVISWVPLLITPHRTFYIEEEKQYIPFILKKITQ